MDHEDDDDDGEDDELRQQQQQLQRQHLSSFSSQSQRNAQSTLSIVLIEIEYVIMSNLFLSRLVNYSTKEIKQIRIV